MSRTRWAAALAAAAATVVVGCGGSSQSHDVTKLAIATPEGAADIGWSQQGVAAAREVGRALHVPVVVRQRLGRADPAPTLTALSKGGASLVIAHGRDYAAAAGSVAEKTGVPELVFEAPERMKANRVGDVEVATQQGGYLAGYISARASYVVSVGIVLAGNDRAWYRTAGGFVAGARKFAPHVKIQYIHVPAGDDDAAASQRAAEREVAHGAQMIIGLGDRSTLGVMHAAKRALNGIGEPRFDVMFVDVIGDKSGAGHIDITGLTAVKWNFGRAFREAARDVRAGSFGKRPYTLDLANGGVSVIADGRTPMDNYEAALRLGRQIESGQLAVPNTTTEAQLQQLLAARTTS